MGSELESALGHFEPKVAADLVLLLIGMCACCSVFVLLWVGVVVVIGAECWWSVVWWAPTGWELCLLSVGCVQVKMVVAAWTVGWISADEIAESMGCTSSDLGSAHFRSLLGAILQGQGGRG